MPDVFISYSRRDKRFAEQLYEELSRRGKDVFVDWNDIPPASDWQRDLEEGIEKSDSLLFVMSPDSVDSQYCRGELDRAKKLNKRIVPLMLREVDESAVPEALRTHNWIFFTDGAALDDGLEQVVRAIDTDPEWVRGHTEWGAKSEEWQRHGRDSSFFVRGNELEEAERWLDGASGKDPAPTQTHYEYIRASRRAATRRQRITLGAAGVAVAVAVTLAAVALVQRSQAISQKHRAESRALAAQAVGALDKDYEVASLMALEAYRLAPTIEARGAVLSALERPVTGNLGYSLEIGDVAYSADGKTVATGSRDGKIRLWDAGTLRMKGAPLVGHTGSITSVAFSANGKLLASASVDRTVRFWNIATHRQLGPKFRDAGLVSDLAFSPKGEKIAMAGLSDNSVHLWDLASSTTARLAGHSGAAYAVAFSPDGKILASGSADKTVRLWSVAKRRQIGAPLRGHTNLVSDVAFSPNGKILASAGSTDNNVRLWNVSTHRQIGQPLTGHRHAVTAIAFNPKGTTVKSNTPLATGSLDGTVRLWTTRRNGVLLLDTLKGQSAIGDLTFSPDGETLATVDTRPALTGGELRFWNALGRSEPSAVLPDRVYATDVAFSPDGRTIASGSAATPGSSDNVVRLWSVQDRQQILPALAGHKQPISSVAFSPDRKTLASAGHDGTVRLWGLAAHRQLGSPLEGHRGLVTSVAFDPSGRVLASGSTDKTIRFWDTTTHRPLGPPLSGHSGTVYAVAFSPAGAGLVSASEDKTVRLWDVASHRQLGRTFTGHTSAVFALASSPDGTRIASGSADSTIRIWDAATHRQIGAPLAGQDAAVNSVAFSPDGRTLASGTRDHLIRLWDVETHRALGEPLSIPGTQYVPVAGLAFNRNGALASALGVLALWDPVLIRHDLRYFTTLVCDKVGRSLTKDEWKSAIPDEPYRRTCPAR